MPEREGLAVKQVNFGSHAVEYSRKLNRNVPENEQAEFPVAKTAKTNHKLCLKDVPSAHNGNILRELLQ